MVHRPKIVFMDEPTAGLDVMSALSLRKFVGSLRLEDMTVFLTTHYIEEADHLSDRLAIIVRGRLVTVDTPENIKNAIRGTSVIEARLSGEPDPSMIRELEALGRVERDGRRIRIVAENVTDVLESLVHLASREGIRIEDVNTVRPSLEDAFVKLTGVSPDVMRAEKERRR